jgi:hypothetical protein
MMREAAFRRTAALKTSRGWTIEALTEPTETTL